MNAAKVLEDLKRRFPNEPEYHQAVEEVLSTIEEEYNKHPEFDKANLIERLCIPDRVYQFRVTWVDDKGNVQKAKLVKLEPKKDEKTGRMMMVPVEGSEKEIPADLVLIAAGFLGSEAYVTEAFGVKVNQRTNVETKPDSFATNVENVFTAGDMHRGQSLVVWAIREGRDAAREVDKQLMGYTNL